MLSKVRFIAVTSAVLVLACGSDDLGSFGKPGGGGGGDAPWSTTTATGSGGAGGATQTSSAGGSGGVGGTGGTGGVGGTAHSTGGFGGTGGSGGQGAAGGSGGVGGGVGGIGGTSGQGGTSSSSTTSTTVSCKAGGDACQGFAECCSGQCAGGICTPCASEGQSCGDPGGCCNTLACYKGACVSCTLDGDSCQASSDCCSNICSNGSCVSCKDLGAACSYDQQCCGSNVCAAGACACPASKHECNGVCEPNTPETGCLGSASCAPCVAPANAVALCTAQGACDFTCNPKYAKSGGTCVFIGDGVCVPSATESCYDGPPGTAGVGACRAGMRTCNAAGSAWGGCIGRVLPKTEVCANGIDDDCNGVVDDGGSDLDGDGWSKCEGDCCDSLADGCATPALVNPGAFDVDGNGFDDDCDGAVDNGAWTCDAGLASNSSAAMDYAKAIDLCKTTVDSPPKAQRTWGVIAAGLSLANGAGTPAANSRSIRSGFGTKVTPRRGAKLAILSTGHAAAKGDVNPGYVAFQSGQDMATSSGPPADWLAANGGKFPSSPGCPAASSTAANDPVMLKLRVRVPTNAKSFSLASFFYSAEYPEWTCSTFNDFFLALLDSSFTPGVGESSNPLDKNLAFVEGAGGLHYPVGVGLAVDSLGLFSACMNGPIGCNGTASSYTKCSSVDELAGTGFDDVTTGCSANNLLGGGTGWLTTTGNVRPGETMELRLVIWDTSDHIYDSLSLVDGFEWSSLSAEPGTRQ